MNEEIINLLRTDQDMERAFQKTTYESWLSWALQCIHLVMITATKTARNE
jgi:hypothetical protein